MVIKMENKKVNIGDIVKTKKKHPCGSDLWEVTRIGADFKIKCMECGRIVMLDREKFMKRIKKIVVSQDDQNKTV
jgi:hypothetical protein